MAMRMTCDESVQTALSRLFDRYGIAEVARAELNHFRVTAPVGMSREQAAAMLRNVASELERSAPAKTVRRLLDENEKGPEKQAPSL